MAQRQRTHRKRRQRGKGRPLFFFFAALLLLFGLVWGGYLLSAAGKPEEAGYPASLITLMENHPETTQFVLDYPANKDRPIQIDLTGEVTKGTVPLFLQWDERWGYAIYGSDFLAVTGCGPTCLSMVVCGLTGETAWDPYAVACMAQEGGYYVSGAGTAWSLMTDGAAALGLSARQLPLSQGKIEEALLAGQPIICAMGPGDFTTSGHFIVLTGTDGAGNITLCDPNSRLNSEKAWPVEELMGQIKNLWCYTLA